MFVYLADVYFARMHAGETLTHLSWVFLYYGPYCSEVNRELARAVCLGLIDHDLFESQKGIFKDLAIYTNNDGGIDEIEEEIPLEVLSPLKTAIRHYGNDTGLLLDHVYFETEPMIEANKGDILDFTKCKPIVPVKPIELEKISDDKITLARQRVKALALKFEQGCLTKESEKIKESEKAEVSKWKRYNKWKAEDDLYYQALEFFNLGK
jgi:hypothetical protein